MHYSICFKKEKKERKKNRKEILLLLLVIKTILMIVSNIFHRELIKKRYTILIMLKLVLYHLILFFPFPFFSA